MFFVHNAKLRGAFLPFPDASVISTSKRLLTQASSEKQHMQKDSAICFVPAHACITFADMKEKDITQLLKSINDSEYLFYKIYESLLEEYCFLERGLPSQNSCRGMYCNT